MATSFGRLLTAMVTPFDEQGAIDHTMARRLARGLVETGSEGLVVAGTTGESPTVNYEEKLQLFQTIKDEVGSEVPIIAGTGDNCTWDSIEFTRRAEAAGVDGVLLVVPYYNKPPQEGLYRHFRAVAESTALPCILYNVPSRTVANLSAETTVRLSAVANIIGVKEASGDLEQVATIRAGTPPEFLIYSGNDSDTFAILSLGGHGVISVASHLVGLRMRRMIDQLLGGDLEGAAAAHLALMPLFRALFTMANPIPLKAALNLLGVPVGTPRLPLIPMEGAALESLRAVLTAQGLTASPFAA